MNQLSSNQLARSNNLSGTVYEQIHEHISFIKKLKLNTELSTKEKDEQINEFKKRIENLSENEARLNVEIESLRNKLSKSESAKAENCQKIDFMFNTIKVLSEELKQFEKHKNDMEKISEVLIKDNELKNQKINDFWQKVGLIENEYKIKLDNNTKEKETLINELKENELKIDELNKRLIEQVNEIKIQNKTILDLTQDSIFKKDQIEKIQTENENISKNLRQKNEEIKLKETEWLQKCQDLESMLSEKTNSESSLKENLTNSHNLISELNQKIDSLTCDLDAKSLEIQNLVEKSKNDISHISKIKSEEIEAKSCVYLEKISALEVQIELLVSKNNDQNGQLTEKDCQIAELSSQIEDLKSKLMNSENLAINRHTEIDKLKNEIKLMEEKNQNDINEMTALLGKITNLESIIKDNEDLREKIDIENKALIQNIDCLNNQDKDYREQIKAKNEDIENWVSKYFELEKKLEIAEANLKLCRGHKRPNGDDSTHLLKSNQDRWRKIRLDEESIREIESSLESDLNICEALDKASELTETQTIPVYQLPKKKEAKKDDYDCLESVEDKYFVNRCKQTKRQPRCLPHLILKNNEPVVTSTPNSPLHNSSSGSDLF